MPFLSVVLPAYNAERYIDMALNSVWQQAVKDIELIVVNDGSTDGTAARLAAYGTDILVLNQDNSGPAAARNSGLEVATGQYIAFIDADDMWPPGRLERQFELMAAHPEVDIVQGQIRNMERSEGQWQLSGSPYFANSMVTALFRENVIKRIGPLDESLLYCEDVDWFFAAQAAGIRIYRDERVSLFYRRHSENMTNRKDLIRLYTLRVVAKHKQNRSPLPV